MRLLLGYSDTRDNNEDFALTPFLFGVWLNGEVIKVYGLGICWGWWSFYLGFGFNVPKEYPMFNNHSKEKKESTERKGRDDNAICWCYCSGVHTRGNEAYCNDCNKPINRK